MSNPPKGRGVLPVTAAATRKSNKSSPRAPAPKLRLIIRRLPPGLTQVEFWDALGGEWQVGSGKVDWAAFKPGKISKDLAKPSRPARAYLKVKEQNLLESLSEKVRQTTFQDAKNTSKDSCLIGPPSLEFAPYNKTPGGRARNDGRQGTIDQDPEFIDFLQSLTEPVTRPAANDPTQGDIKDKTNITTPLVQFIKEKKANKAKEKEAAAAKASKKGQDGKDGKGTSGKSEPRSKVVKSTTANADKIRVQKATDEAVKAANRSAASIQAKSNSAKTDAKASAKASDAPPQTATKRERQRGDASVAARMVARDLGLAPKEGKSGRAAKAASKNAESAPTASVASQPSTPPTAPAASASKTAASSVQTTGGGQQPPTGPRNARQNQPKQQTQQVSQKSPKPSPQPSADAKSAFLKHANPSQGVTEDLLRENFSIYGTITRCEIDKKKGLGYIDFTEPEALKKAMAASPVKIGNGQVVVLENRSPYKKGGPQQGDGQAPKGSPSVRSPALSAASSPKPAVASMAATQPIMNIADATADTVANDIGDPQATLSEAKTEDNVVGSNSSENPPTAPRGARGGRGNYRGGRGGHHRGRGRGGGGRGGGNPSQGQQNTPGTNNNPPAAAGDGT